MTREGYPKRVTKTRLIVGIQSPRGYRWDTCRIPDVMVLTMEQWDAMDQREAVILAHEPPPKLVVEVVSPQSRFYGHFNPKH